MDKVRPYTMVPDASLTDLACQVRAALTLEIPGNFVECGTWRGGASFLMAGLLRQAGVTNRKVWMFDSFEGLPPPEEIDGPAALAYAENVDSPHYFDNCSVSLEEVRQAASELGVTPLTELVKGWFSETLPAMRERIGPIAILRIDGDWYSSVRCCLDYLYDQVVDGGCIIIDDYYAYEGCAIAIHEFLGERRLPHRIESVIGESDGYEDHQSAVLRKGTTTWLATKHHMTTRHLLGLAIGEITDVIPRNRAFILVDEDRLRGLIASDLRPIPFLERDGEYWGKPADDATAIRELERLRRSGASSVVFMWVAFWWLDYYSEFRRYLRSRFRCVLENDRVIAFDLQP